MPYHTSALRFSNLLETRVTTEYRVEAQATYYYAVCSIMRLSLHDLTVENFSPLTTSYHTRH